MTQALITYIIQSVSVTHTLTLTDKHIKTLTRYLTKNIDMIVTDMYEVYEHQYPHQLQSQCHWINKTKYRYVCNKQIKNRGWGKIQLMHKKYDASQLLLPIFVKEIYHGHSGVASGVQFICSDLVRCMHEMTEALEDRYHPDPVSPKTNITMNTKCNRDEIRKYINDKSIIPKYRRVAKKILCSLDLHDYLHQDIKMPIEDRVYLKGLNLQQVKSEVRAICVSGQMAYDVNCAVFAIFASVAHEITSKEFKVLKDYITNRSQVRCQIHKECGMPIEEIKRTLIGIGFGKRIPRTSPLHSSNTAMSIINEFRISRNIVYSKFKIDGIPKNKCLSHLFFKWENELMQSFIKYSNVPMNLLVFDCVYFLQSINIDATLKLMHLNFTTKKEYFIYEETKM